MYIILRISNISYGQSERTNFLTAYGPSPQLLISRVFKFMRSILVIESIPFTPILLF